MNVKRLRSACTILALMLALGILVVPAPALAESTAPAADAAAASTAEGDAAQDAEAAEEEPALRIVSQPVDVEVNYPGGASFSVGVSDPSLVKSYQWIISDGYSDFVLDGTSAATDTLVIPSTMQDDPDLYARCVITGTDGEVIESEPAVMHVLNGEEEKPVLYVGDRALEPGQTMNLAAVGLGSGRVSFNLDARTITFEDVNFTNEAMTYDRRLSPGLAIFFMYRNSPELEYYIELKGDNVFTNTFFDKEYNSAGIVLNTYFGSGDNPNPPTIYIRGDGSLELNGGSHAIYSDAHVEIDAAVSTQTDGEVYLDAVTARGIFVEGNARLSLDCNGTALRANEDLRIFPGAVIDIASSAPRVGVGATAKSIVSVDGSIYMDGATMTIRGKADPARFVPHGTMVANFTGISYGGDFDLRTSTVNIEMTELESDEDFSISCYGISGDGPSSALTLTGKSHVGVKLDVPTTPFTGGIALGGLLDADEGSTVEVNVTSAGETLGVMSDRAVTLNDASLISTVASTSAEATTYGVACAGLKVEYSVHGQRLRSTAKNGIALAVDTGEHGDFTVKPARDYIPKFIDIVGPAVCTRPTAAQINLVGTPGYGETIKAETIYESSNMDKPASEVEIAIPDPGGSVVAIGIVSAAAVGLAIYLITRKKITTKKKGVLSEDDFRETL